MTYSNTYSSPSSPTNFNPFSGMGMRKGGRPSLFPGSGDGSTLSLDFTTGVLDSRLTFSRASTATFVNSSGYVEYAGANLVRQSGNLSLNGVGEWTTRTNLTLTGWSGNPDPFGGSTAVNIIPNNVSGTHHVGTADISMSIGIPYTVSVYVKAAGYSIVGLVTTNSNARAHFNLATQTSAGYGVTNTRTITAVGGGWYRITMSFTVASGPLVSLLIYAMSNATDPVADSFAGTAGDTDGVLAWGAQINPGSTAQTYYPTTTAAYHAPRFDYSPTNIGEPRGLLVEGAATNLFQQSNDWTVSPWSKPVQITWDGSTTATAPDGVSAAKQITVTSGSSASVSNAVASGTDRSLSVWIKAGSLNSFSIGIFNPADAWGTGGTNTASIISGPGSIVQQVGSLWYFTGLSTSQWTRVQLFRSVASTNILAYPGSASGSITGTAYLWGAQLEAGSGASSYIPTGASGVTRNADSCLMNDISSLSYSTTNGSMVYEGRFSKINSASYPTRMGFLTNAGGDPAFEIFTNGTTIFSGIRSTAANNEITRTIAIDTNYKFATAFNASAASQVRCSLNGAAAVGSGTSALTNTRVPTVFGFTRSGYELYFPCGSIKTAKYWNTTLSDADLVSKST